MRKEYGLKRGERMSFDFDFGKFKNRDPRSFTDFDDEFDYEFAEDFDFEEDFEDNDGFAL